MKRIILRVLFKLGVLRYLNLAWTVNRYGQTFNIPLLGNTGLEYFLAEKESWMLVILKKMDKLTQGRGAFLDVGANIGQTFLKVKSLNNSWEYIGFEPNPNCLQYLFNLTKVNGFSSARFLPLGLSDRFTIGRLSLFNESPVDSAASIIAGFRPKPVESFAVPLVSYGEISDLLGSLVSVVKIDVEGGELEVLKGLRSLIERDRPFIVCEVLPVYSNELRLDRQLEMERILHDLGYIKFRIDFEGRLSFCQEIGVHHVIENVNYLFCPESTCDAVTHHFDVLA